MAGPNDIKKRNVVDELRRTDDRVNRLEAILGSLRGNRYALAGQTPEVTRQGTGVGEVTCLLDKVVDTNNRLADIIDELETEARLLGEHLGTV